MVATPIIPDMQEMEMEDHCWKPPWAKSTKLYLKIQKELVGCGSSGRALA
jgi:hypothetical protein